MLTASFLRTIETILGKKINKKLHIRRVAPISGGSINLAGRVDTTAGIFFLKANDAFKYPGMFEKEARGLDVLRTANAVKIPKVILTGEEEGQSFLILEFIESRSRNKDFWAQFGSSLAELHRNTNQRFGFEEDNYIGSLVQSNKQYNRWLDFFVEERLDKQLQLAIVTGRMNTTDDALFRKLYMHLDSLIPIEPPSLLHGDLWNGNFMTGNDGEAWLVDPAIYFGHREMDLAMSKLFGGFEQEFYDSYSSEFPLAPGFDDRVDIHNLYPLMVHVNLFGGSYIQQVRSILKRYN